MNYGFCNALGLKKGNIHFNYPKGGMGSAQGISGLLQGSGKVNRLWTLLSISRKHCRLTATDKACSAVHDRNTVHKA